jgi:hypothetical protein
VRKLFRGKESADQREGREPLSKAKEIAEDWYLQLRGKLRAGEIKSEIRGNLKWQSRAKPGETPAGKV